MSEKVVCDCIPEKNETCTMCDKEYNDYEKSEHLSNGWSRIELICNDCRV